MTERDVWMIEIKEIGGIEEFSEVQEKERKLYKVSEKVFLVENKNTIEVRCDFKLAKLLREKYESVMESRYFGRGGIEIVMSGQLEESEVFDLVRLSYNMTKEIQDDRG